MSTIFETFDQYNFMVDSLSTELAIDLERTMEAQSENRFVHTLPSPQLLRLLISKSSRWRT